MSQSLTLIISNPAAKPVPVPALSPAIAAIRKAAFESYRYGASGGSK